MQQRCAQRARAPRLPRARAEPLPSRAPAAVEKFADNLEKAAQAVKDQMDKKFGAPWNVVIGEYFAFEITYEVKNLLYLFIGGTKGVLLWKSA